MINSYEELLQVADKRREETLTIEVDMGAVYSQPHEDAKRELKQAEALQQLSGGEGGFLSNNLDTLKQKVEETRPEPNLIWVRYKRLDLPTWSMLTRQAKANTSAIDQYEKVLEKVFVGIFNDPDSDTPLTEDHTLVSTSNAKSILPGGVLNSVINSFMQWQNSGGEVSIHPTSSGHA